jgi:hypothetical protein
MEKRMLLIAVKNLLKEICDKYENAPLECDGLTKVISTALYNNGINSYKCYLGEVKFGRKKMSPHMWIEIDGIIIDYRTRMWLGESEEVGHGVFFPEEFPKTKYDGVEIPTEILPKYIFDFMLEN